jgi:hypothetical protein
MRLVTREDMTALGPMEWETYMSERLSFVGPDRHVSYEWESIKTAVREYDGHLKYVAKLSLSEHYTRSLT